MKLNFKKSFFMFIRKLDRGFYPFFSLMLLFMVVAVGGYFVTSDRSFDDRGRASESANFQNLFGGMYSENMNKTCKYKNALTGACSCPENFQAVRIFDFNVPGVAQYHHYYCALSNKVLPLKSEENIFGGMYSKNADETCRFKNNFTGACSCPEGFNRVGTLEFYNPNRQDGYYCDNNPQRKVCGFFEYYCVSDKFSDPAIAGNTFGGIYTANDDETCRYKNNFTGACSCPNGFEPTLVHHFPSDPCRWYGDNGVRTTRCGVKQYYCTSLGSQSKPKCGTYNEQLFLSSEQSWPLGGTFCKEGTSIPEKPVFPKEGNVTHWNCSANNQIVPCSAGKELLFGCKTNADCNTEVPSEVCLKNTCFKGDVNADGQINITDFVEFKKDFMSFKQNGWSELLKRSDFNLDKKISLADYSIFVETFRAVKGL
jgi:hypothetical protein